MAKNPIGLKLTNGLTKKLADSEGAITGLVGEKMAEAVGNAVARELRFEDLERGEWDPMNKVKAFTVRAELLDWKRAREAGGYDVRLIEGAIAVCEAFLRN